MEYKSDLKERVSNHFKALVKLLTSGRIDTTALVATETDTAKVLICNELK